MLTTDDPILLRHDDGRGVTTLTLNRPQAFNSLSEAMLAALQRELDILAADEDLRVLVIAANGKAFCAGHDLKEMRAQPSLDYYRRLFDRCGKMMMSLQRMPVPVIAQVQGIATAAGCQLVAQCDLAVASSAARFAVSGVNLGLFCSTPGVALSRNLSRKAAFEMLATGDFITAEQALQKGLINRVAQPDALSAALESLIDSILKKPREALAIGKALFYRQLESGLEAAYTDAAYTMACNMMEDTALEGVQAFIDKRAPTWAVAG
jgi:enoyl-CoA hydratase/carnithine racemase